MEKKTEWAKLINPVPLFNSCIVRRGEGIVDPDYPVPVESLEFYKKIS